MITEIVSFDLPAGIDRETLIEKYRQTAPAWSKNPDLIHKFCYFDEDRNIGGGIYIWKTRDAAEKWHGDDFRTRVRELYGSDPQMTRYDTLVVVDNVSSRISEPEPA